MEGYHILATTSPPAFCIDDVFLGLSILAVACVVALVYLAVVRFREERHE